MTESMTQDINQADIQKPLPAWASILVILLCLGGGGWMVHWYVKTDTLTHDSSIISENVVAGQPAKPKAVKTASARRSAPAPAPDQPPVRQQDQNTWWVHSPEAAMLISQPAGSPPTIMAINYVSYDFVPQDDKNKIIYARRIVNDSAVSTSLKVTSDQVAQMKKLTGQIRMVTEQTDRDQLTALWVEYQASNDKPGVTVKLVQALSGLAKQSLDRTRQAAVDRAAKIKAVLTDDQWKQFDSMGH